MNDNILRAYGFIYITTNSINGKRYIGQCSLHRACWKSYLGSGKALKRAIKKHGRENFERKILCHCFSKEDMNVVEERIIADYDAVNNRNFYNIIASSTATNGFLGKTHTEEWKEARRQEGRRREPTEKMRENMRRVCQLPKTEKQIAAAKIQAKQMGLANAKPKIYKEHQCPICNNCFEVLEYKHHILDTNRVCSSKCGGIKSLKSRKNVKMVEIDNMIYDNAKEAGRILDIRYHTVRKRLVSENFPNYRYLENKLKKVKDNV